MTIFSLRPSVFYLLLVVTSLVISMAIYLVLPADDTGTLNKTASAEVPQPVNKQNPDKPPVMTTEAILAMPSAQLPLPAKAIQEKLKQPPETDQIALQQELDDIQGKVAALNDTLAKQGVNLPSVTDTVAMAPNAEIDALNEDTQARLSALQAHLDKIQ